MNNEQLKQIRQQYHKYCKCDQPKPQYTKEQEYLNSIGIIQQAYYCKCGGMLY